MRAKELFGEEGRGTFRRQSQQEKSCETVHRDKESTWSGLLIEVSGKDRRIALDKDSSLIVRFLS